MVTEHNKVEDINSFMATSTDKKRILIMVNDVTGGGVERVANINAYELSKRNEIITGMVSCCIRPEYITSENHFVLKDFRKTAKITGVIGTSFNYKAMNDCLLSFKPDIVHIHSYIHFSPGALRALAVYKKERGCAIVLTHHTFSYVCPNDALYNYRFGCLCEKCLDGNTRHILTDRCYGSVLPSLGKYIQKSKFKNIFSNYLIDVHISPSGFLKEKLRSVNPEINIQVIQNPCIDHIITEIPNKKDGKAVCFGRISREKNISAAVRAVLNNSNKLYLTIIGDGPEAGKIQTLISNSNNSLNGKSIIFLNAFLSANELYSQIADAQYFLMPSVCYESSSISLVEALNLGITPIVSGWGGMKETVDIAGVGYTFDPDDGESMQTAINSAIINRKKDEVLFKDHVQNKLDLYTYKTHMKKLIELYESVRGKLHA